MTNPPHREKAREFFQQMQERLASAERIREQATELIGKAESSDGLVRLASTTTDPAYEVYLDPRAMRLPSADLAEHIQQAARAARADLERQQQELTRELMDDEGPLAMVKDPGSTQARLAELSRLAASTAGNAEAIMERLHQQFGQ